MYQKVSKEQRDEHYRNLSERYAIDLIGKRFGLWTVLSRAASPKYRVGCHAYWLCECDCGKQLVVLGANLRRGKSNACQSCAAYIRQCVRYGKRYTIKGRYAVDKSI